MPTYKTIFHQEQNKPLIQKAKWCNNFGSKLQGFMFKKTLTPEEALVLVEKSENRVNTAIHMLFMNFDLGVLWVNASGEVVDKTYAKRWKLQYTPSKPAQYVIEMHPSLLDVVKIGDHIEFQ